MNSKLQTSINNANMLLDSPNLLIEINKHDLEKLTQAAENFEAMMVENTKTKEHRFSVYAGFDVDEKNLSVEVGNAKTKELADLMAERVSATIGIAYVELINPHGHSRPDHGWLWENGRCTSA